MSQAFVRESKEQLLHEVTSTLKSLNVYLTRKNNGIGVYELMNFMDTQKVRMVHMISNDLSYSRDEENKWYIA